MGLAVPQCFVFTAQAFHGIDQFIYAIFELFYVQLSLQTLCLPYLLSNIERLRDRVNGLFQSLPRGILSHCFPTVIVLRRAYLPMQDLNYQDVTDALARLGIASDAAECQGAMSAVICFAGEDGFEVWLGSHLPEIESARMQGDALATETVRITEALYSDANAQLQASALGYQLFLPDDDTDLEVRTQAMVHWCQGFLLGLRYVGVADTGQFQDELAEIINDITEIAQMTIGELDYSEEEERSYTELVEYLRVGVMLFWETLSARGSTSSTSTLH